MIESWRTSMPTTKEILTVADHHKICKAITEEVANTIKEQTIDLKDFFDVKIENVLLKEIRKLNNK